MSVKSVLVVDDSEAEQFLMRRLLMRHLPDVEVLQAFDGREALEIVELGERHPDVILLDINMPGMNGHEFLDAYDAYARKSAVIVMLTSSNRQEDKSRALAHACVKRFALKPLDASVLAELLRDHAEGA